MNAATVFEDAQSGDERSLDAAFEAVEIASRFYSTSISLMVEERWLWGSSWKSVAFKSGCTRQTAFERCMSCFGWMDRHIEFVDGGDGLHAEYVPWK